MPAAMLPSNAITRMGNKSATKPLLSPGQRLLVLSAEGESALLLGPDLGRHYRMGSGKHGRVFGGGGFHRTMEQQRSRRRSSLSVYRASRPGQSESSLDEVWFLVCFFLGFFYVSIPLAMKMKWAPWCSPAVVIRKINLLGWVAGS